MNELTKTIVFVAVGVALAAGAFGVHVLSQPKQNDDFALVGEEFYPEFDSPSSAKSLEIVAFDFEKRKPVEFRVEYKDKLWRIPSHHGYPAEAADRLARTAASVMGIRREAIRGRREGDYKQFGVIDPKSEAATKIGKNEKDAVGIRVTVGKQDGKVLADYIIGKEVESQDLDDEFLREIRGESARKPLHYVRRPDEKETYIAAVSVDASTKFSDWIEPDLLLLDSDDLRELVINDYSFETKVEEVEVFPGVFQQVARSEKVDGEAYTLTKDSDFGSWEMEGLDEETEELDTAKISDVTRGLDNFEIRGVRPRVKINGLPILTQELKLEIPEAMQSDRRAVQVAIQEVAMDLEEKGFNLLQDPQDHSLSIASDQGELSAATSKGVVYRLYFGKVFTGTDAEIEIGGAANADQPKEDEGQDEKDSEDQADADSDSENGRAEDADEKKSRYLLVRLEFDPKYLGDAPTPPVEPKEPEKPVTPKADDEEKAEPAQPPTTPEAGTPMEIDPEADGTASDSKAAESAEAPESSAVEEVPPDADAASKGTDDELDSADEQTTEGAATADEDESSETAESESESEAGDNQDDAEDPEAEYLEAMEEYQLAKVRYETDKKQYEENLAAYEKKIAEGKDKVAKLNERFADWYYVVSAGSIENLRLSRSDLVQEKEKPEDDMTEEGEKMDEAATANQMAADEFLAENKTKEGVVTTDSGLQYKVLTEGEGESPKASNRVKVKYKGTLLDGTVFDESDDQPVEFGVTQVIKGWTEALQLMKPGAKWRLFIPPDLAYGESGSGSSIGPNALLIFDVELVSFE